MTETSPRPPGDEDEASLDPLERWFLFDETDAEAFLATIEDDGERERVRRLIALDAEVDRGFEALSETGISARETAADEGLRLGDYRLLREVARGGMGRLFLARDEVLKRLVAVKLLARPTQRLADRFRREAEIVASITHPNIVPVYARGEQSGHAWIAMRFVTGEDVDVFARGLSPSKRPSTLARLAETVARALHHAHEQGVIHRDVKPSNILVEASEPVIIDFGLAIHAGDVRLTREGDLVGTVTYMSPEQVRGQIETLDARTDVYSLGATLYQALCGVPPFDGTAATEVAKQVLMRDPAPMSRRGVPRDLEAIVFRALEKDRERRYADAAAMAEDLRRFVAGEPVRARPIGPVRRWLRLVARHRWFASLTALALLAALVAGGLLWRDRARDRKLRIDRYEQARSAWARGDGAEAASLLESVVDRGAADARERELFARARKSALFERAMDLLFFDAERELDGRRSATVTGPLRRILDEAIALGRPDVLGEHFRFLDLLALRNRGDVDAARMALADWRRANGGPTRRTEVVSAILEAGLGQPLSWPALQAARQGHPAAGPIDHFLSGLALALSPGGELPGIEELTAYRKLSDEGLFWERFIEGNLQRRVGHYDASRQIYTGLLVMLAGDASRTGQRRRDICRFQRAQAAQLAGDHEEALHDLEAAASGLAPWRLAMSRARSQACLGNFASSESQLLKAIDDLETRRRGATDFDAGLWERHLGEAWTGLVRVRVGRRDFEGAELALAACRDANPKGEVPGVLLAWILVERQRAGDLDLDSARAGLEGLAVDDPDERIRLLLLELRFIAGDATERAEILATLDRGPEVSPQRRYWRASLRVLHLIETLEDLELVRPPTDHRIVDFEDALDRSLEQIADLARRAADDLGALDPGGSRDFAITGPWVDPAESRFLLTVARDLAGDVATADRDFKQLRTSVLIHSQPWRHLIWLLHGRRQEHAGQPALALETYLEGLERGAVSAWLLRRAGRLAAGLKDENRLARIITLMRAHEPAPGWTDRELALPEYQD
ncbi:MAG: serine/threonine protein kinase [Planctomycetes bacterium]|nr:serine/threonine protein kinase [Planctomycetota bacterium]